MDKVFDFFLETIRKLPSGLQVFIIFILLLAYPFYRIMMSANFQKLFIRKIQRRINKLSQKDLSNNQIFLVEDYFRTKIEHFVFDTQVKTDVFKIILSSKIESNLHLVSKFIKEKNFADMSVYSLSKEMSNLVTIMVKSYDELALDRLMKKYGQDCGQEIYSFVMNSKKGYRCWRKSRIDRIFLYINEYIEKSSIYDNNIERVDTFLYEIKKSIKDAIFEVEKEFKAFNGEFTEILNKY